MSSIIQIQRIIGLADEIVTCASAIAGNKIDSDDITNVDVWSEVPSSQKNSVLLGRAKSLYKLRRSRDSLFNGKGLFADPAWDILLDLFINHFEGRKLSTTDACIGSNVPTTTALRWLNVLEEGNLLRREDDIGDSRRTFVFLTKNALDHMSELLGPKFSMRK